MSYWSFSGRGEAGFREGAELFHIRYGQRRPLHSPRSVDHQAAITRAPAAPTQYIRRLRRCALLLRRRSSGKNSRRRRCGGVQTCRRTAASGATSTSRLRRRFTLLPAKLSSYWDVSYTSIVETIRTFRAERCGPPDGANSCNHGSL